MKYVCIHGHCYQPPRENPWTGEIDLQPSAAPYHDWNERILAECYGPNTDARILDGERRILKIVNNYSRSSFNFGATLLAWLEAKAPSAYQAIIEADNLSRQRFSGHGSALAQPYNHMILPLAATRDKYTQVYWGIEDFRHRFGRLPEGMWLPETAVDLESLDIMSKLGIRFTLLAPRQARAVRRLGGTAWKDVSGARIDPTRAYLVNLPSGRTIHALFFDGPVSQAIAFEHLLDSGEKFAHRLLSTYSGVRVWPQLIHVASDGETYGHHHKFGEMALAYCLEYLERNDLARIINYGEYLERAPSDCEVLLYENTSWSCVHGIDRWKTHCGCNAGHDDWSQEWRRPLREAMDWLRDSLAPKFAEKAGSLLKDPWGARNDYISLLIDRSVLRREQFLRKHTIRTLGDSQRVLLWRLLELQRNAMLMYTSCGWFFDDVSGIETVQILRYAGRVAQLAEALFGEPVEAPLLEKLAHAKSNLGEHRDAAHLYLTLVRPGIVPLANDLAISRMEHAGCEGLGILRFAVSGPDEGRGLMRHLLRSSLAGEQRTLVEEALAWAQSQSSSMLQCIAEQRHRTG